MIRLINLMAVSMLALGAINLQAQEVKSLLSEEGIPHVVIKNATNLVADAKKAKSKQVPVLLFFSMEHCPFCTIVEEDFLKPMLRNDEYDSKVIIRKIKIDDSIFVTDFKGESREPGEFSDDYHVSMVPTLVLVDPNGKVINPSIVGIRNTEYYSAELDDAIDASILKIRALAKR